MLQNFASNLGSSDKWPYPGITQHRGVGKWLPKAFYIKGNTSCFFCTISDWTYWFRRVKYTNIHLWLVGFILKFMTELNLERGSWHTNMPHTAYCWWTKIPHQLICSLYPFFLNRGLYIRFGAGFLPRAVFFGLMCSCGNHIPPKKLSDSSFKATHWEATHWMKN